MVNISLTMNELMLIAELLDDHSKKPICSEISTMQILSIMKKFIKALKPRSMYKNIMKIRSDTLAVKLGIKKIPVKK